MWILTHTAGLPGPIQHWPQQAGIPITKKSSPQKLRFAKIGGSTEFAKMWHQERMLHTLTIRNRHRSLSLQGREGGTEMCPNVAVINECFKPCKRELSLKEVLSREVKMIVVFAAACFDRRVCGVCSTGHSTRSMP